MLVRMKLSLALSTGLHLALFAALLLSRPGRPEWEGYPTVIPVELVKMEPVSYQAPEVEKIQPRPEPPQPPPREQESVTLEKAEPVEKPAEEPPPPEPEPETVQEESGKSVVGDEKMRLDVEEFPFSYYLALLKSRIQANWEPPVLRARLTDPIETVVYFKIQRSGQITNIVVETSSGNFIYDQAAVRAVTLANPLPPLPYDFPERELGVHFEFEQIP